MLAKPEDVKSNYYFILAPDSKGQVLHLAEIFNAEDISFATFYRKAQTVRRGLMVIINSCCRAIQLENITASLKKLPV